LPDEPPDAFEARKAKRDEWVAKAEAAFELAYVRAIETGKWDALKRPDTTPTVFWCRPVPGPLWRRFMDHVSKEDSDLGGFQRPALAFRLAVVRIDGFAPGFKFEPVEHLDKRGERSGLGLVLPDTVIATLDDIDPMIVTVLGYSIFKNRRGPHPL
jgi:hypothetical protein